jgi:hypothetical protein
LRLWRNRLLKFFRLRKECRMLLIRTFFCVMSIRLLLLFFPFVTLQKEFTTVRPRPHPHTINGIHPDEIAWAVKTASRYVFRATCLVQALATQVLLTRESISSVLYIGVLKTENSSFEAHAWIESEGRIVIGGSEIGPFKKLVSFQNNR